MADGTPRKPKQTPEELYKQFSAALSSIAQTAGVIAAGIDDARKRWPSAEAIAGAINRAQKIGSQIGATMVVIEEAWEKKAVPVLRVVKQNADTASRAAEIGTQLTTAGWVPWIHSPVKTLLESPAPVTEFERWTTAEWSSISKRLIASAEQYRLGDSPIRTIQAAVMLHENGCYEQVPRVLFPEIEKCVAEHFYKGRVPHEQNQLPEIRGFIEMIWGLATTGFALLAPGLGVGRGQMQILELHSYVPSSKKNPPPTPPNADCFPNRNRVIHGWETGDYHSPKASLNSMFMYDIMLQGLAFAVALNSKGLKIEGNDVPGPT